MEQNCIAGTTEYDEENGIGLVMYVESGNNMIVWKMSDGTKQGTTVPVSSDYQNMLRSAFENKTGTKIGYFIFHPYTEETIDIESSITINSGDTPEETPIAISLTNVNKSNIAGILRTVNGIKQMNVYISQDTQKCFIINDTGLVVEKNGPSLNEGFNSSIIGKCERIGINIDEVQAEVQNFDIGGSITNWDSYIKVPYVT